MEIVTDDCEGMAYYAWRPYEFVVDIIGVIPDSQQESALRAVPKAIMERKRLCVKSGHGVGKTAFLAWLILWFMNTRPNCRIPCTAPTQNQLFDVLWAELAKWHARMKTREGFVWTRTHYCQKDSVDTWFSVARASNKAENMQGFHAEHLMFIIEEASGVPDAIMEAVEGTLTQEGSFCVMVGNPTKLSGSFFDAFHSKRGFVIPFTFSSIDSPLVTKEYSDDLKRKYGEDSNIYRVRVLGEFPKEEPDTIISLELVERAAKREVIVSDDDRRVEIGVDVARFGNDETVIMVRRGWRVSMDLVLKGKDTMTVANNVFLVAKKYSNFDVTINVDDSGLGGGVTDRLNEFVKERRLRAVVNGVNNGSRAVSPDKFVNLGSEMWLWVGEHIENMSIPDDQDLIGQLSTRKYGVPSGKVCVERKEDMKRRGLTSPDRADALVLSFFSLVAPFGKGYSPCLA